MKFGHLNDIQSIDFSLPPDHPITEKVLKGKKVKQLEVYSGLPEWGSEGFPGKIYPEGAKPKDFLRFYAAQFNAIELNATGYRIPSLNTIKAWTSVVPNGFAFCPKVSQPISHVRPLGKSKEALQQCCDAMHAFEEHLGAVFLQLHPSFSTQRLDDLLHFFDLWDPSLPIHVELRHPDWFSNSEVLDSLFEEMRLRKIGTIITDTSGRRDAIHQCLTTPVAFIRFDGNDLDPSDFTRIDEWAKRCKQWIEHGLKGVYFFAHTPTKSLNPELSNHFLAQLNNQCGFNFKLAQISKGE
ncbi:MAG: DUF72 domain-containing protein [Bacteroidota bacterium]|nr:DUF72 domain-containing protein [Bacteroidota bacterium]